MIPLIVALINGAGSIRVGFVTAVNYIFTD